jgi:hypothetical protein
VDDRTKILPTSCQYNFKYYEKHKTFDEIRLIHSSRSLKRSIGTYIFEITGAATVEESPFNFLLTEVLRLS